MEEAKLQWFVRAPDTSASYSPTTNIYLGTHTPKQHVGLHVQLWNNRYGTEEVSALRRFTVKLSFRDTEDAALLKYIKVTNDDGQDIETQLYDTYALLSLPESTAINGVANNGVAQENTHNYLGLRFMLDTPDDILLKENDLKHLYLEVVDK